MPGESIIFVLFSSSYKDDIEVVWTPWSLDKAAVFKSLPISFDVSVDFPAPEFPTKRMLIFFMKLISWSRFCSYLAEQLIISIFIFL